MIVVTGATGHLGRIIVEKLAGLVPAAQVSASVRDPAKAAKLKALGVRVRRGDFNDPDSLKYAFEGATQVLMVSSNARASGGDTVAQHRSAIAAARAVGVRRIVYTSHMAASASSAFAPMLDHRATEEMLQQSGLAWTALRNGFYANTVAMMIGDAVSSGILTAPADGKVSWTTHADLAAAAAAILLQEGRFEGPTPPLTAPDALDLGDVAAILADLHGRPVERQIIADEEQAAAMAQRGVSRSAIEITLGLYRAARAGEFAAVDPALAKLIGRKPMTLREVLTAGRDA